MRESHLPRIGDLNRRHHQPRIQRPLFFLLPEPNPSHHQREAALISHSQFPICPPLACTGRGSPPPSPLLDARRRGRRAAWLCPSSTPNPPPPVATSCSSARLVEIPFLGECSGPVRRRPAALDQEGRRRPRPKVHASFVLLFLLIICCAPP